MGVVVAPGVWMRRPTWGIAASTAFYVVNAVFWVGTGIYALTVPQGRNSTLLVVVLMSIFAALAAGSAWAAVRTPRAGLRIGPRGVTLRGVWFTRELALADVERFTPGVFSSGLMRSSVGVKIKRPHHAFYLLVGAMRSGEESDKSSIEAALANWQRVCDELNQLLHAMRGEAPPRSAGSGEEVLTREKADRAYRLIRLYLIGSALWFLAIAAAMFALQMSGRVVYLAVVVVAFGLVAPLALRRYRRELDDRVGKQEPPD
jgi:hypothetical protein